MIHTIPPGICLRGLYYQSGSHIFGGSDSSESQGAVKANISVQVSDSWLSATQNFTVTVGIGKKGPGR